MRNVALEGVVAEIGVVGIRAQYVPSFIAQLFAPAQTVVTTTPIMIT